MSRAGYIDDWGDDAPPPEFWHRAVENAIRGRRGQALLKDLRDAMDALPQKRLIASELRTVDGEVCALGAVGVRRNVDMSALIRPADCAEEDWNSDWECEVHENSEILASWLNIAPALAREVMYQNDDERAETPEQRWVRMRRWVARKLGEQWSPDSASAEHE